MRRKKSVVDNNRAVLRELNVGVEGLLESRAGIFSFLTRSVYPSDTNTNQSDFLTFR
jgi:hypothetical protein